MSEKISFSDNVKTTTGVIRNMLDYVEKNWRAAYDCLYKDYRIVIDKIKKMQPFLPADENSEYWLYHELADFLEAHPPTGLKFYMDQNDPEENKYINTEVAFVEV